MSRSLSRHLELNPTPNAPLYSASDLLGTYDAMPMQRTSCSEGKSGWSANLALAGRCLIGSTSKPNLISTSVTPLVTQAQPWLETTTAGCPTYASAHTVHETAAPGGCRSKANADWYSQRTHASRLRHAAKCQVASSSSLQRMVRSLGRYRNLSPPSRPPAPGQPAAPTPWPPCWQPAPTPSSAAAARPASPSAAPAPKPAPCRT